jgi:hypothetical protein
VRSALGGEKEREESAEEGGFHREGVVCATRHSAKVTSKANHGKLCWSLSLTIAPSLSVGRQALGTF